MGEIKDNNKKSFLSKYVFIGICGVIVISILAVVVSVILFFYSLSQSAIQAEQNNEAKKLMVPVESFASSQGWKSVSVFNNPAGGDSAIPTYTEVFLTSQSPARVEEEMLTLLNEKGYHKVSPTLTPSDEDVYPSPPIDPSENNLQGTSTEGNDIYVTLSTKQYINSEDGSYATVPSGMTAVSVEFDYNVYEKQLEKSSASNNFSCVGTGCPK